MSNGAPLTRTGLLVSGLGWMCLAAALSLRAGAIVVAGFDWMALTIIGAATLTTGLGVAILGALQEGFGALDRFFVAALARAALRRDSQMPPPEQNRVLRRGIIRDRAYAQYEDGSVEMETLLGTRRFRSMAEAQDFVGA